MMTTNHNLPVEDQWPPDRQQQLKPLLNLAVVLLGTGQLKPPTTMARREVAKLDHFLQWLQNVLPDL
ncbi:hypothetical protein ES332_D09G100400v1 [Gossypium tomentosum]|uniref:Uncharacterized protein n=1 Tax=Gossypium tomentosum TaxID=34277 RepID=A0A5D2JGE3_GOSTO|nr:hypothetical protein ES332_D09G100400v1 [Gossypium tomentosum]